MEHSFEPLKNDLLLRAARGMSRLKEPESIGVHVTSNTLRF